MKYLFYRGIYLRNLILLTLILSKLKNSFYNFRQLRMWVCTHVYFLASSHNITNFLKNIAEPSHAVLTLLELWSASWTLCTRLLRACLLPLGVTLLLKRSLLLNLSASQSYFSVATTTSHGDGTEDDFFETGETLVLSWSGNPPHLCSRIRIPLSIRLANIGRLKNNISIEFFSCIYWFPAGLRGTFFFLTRSVAEALYKIFPLVHPTILFLFINTIVIIRTTPWPMSWPSCDKMCRCSWLLKSSWLLTRLIVSATSVGLSRTRSSLLLLKSTIGSCMRNSSFNYNMINMM